MGRPYGTKDSDRGGIGQRRKPTKAERDDYRTEALRPVYQNIDKVPLGWVSIREIELILGDLSHTALIAQIFTPGKIEKVHEYLGKLNAPYTDENGFYFQRGTYIDHRIVNKVFSNLAIPSQSRARARMYHLGINRDLSPLDPERGILRASYENILEWELMLRENKKANIANLKMARYFNMKSTMIFNPKGIYDSQYTPDPENGLKTPSPAVVEPVSRPSSPENPTEIDYTDSDEVLRAMNKSKLEGQIVKTEKDKLALALLSNSTVQLSEIEGMLVGAVTAMRASFESSVPKLAANITGAFITEIVRKRPELASVISSVLEPRVVVPLVRSETQKALTEVSNALEMLAKQEESVEPEETDGE